MAKARTGTVSLFADMKKVNNTASPDREPASQTKPVLKKADKALPAEKKPEAVRPESTAKTEKKNTENESAIKTEKAVENEKTLTEKASASPEKNMDSDKSEKNTDAAETEQEAAMETNVSLKQPDGICQTSVSIQQSSANFLRYWSKKNGVNQDTGLAQIISEEMQTGIEQIPDFFAMVERRSRTGCVSKSIRLPEKILTFAKEQAANEMKTLGAYVDDLLQKRMKEVQSGHRA